MTKQAIDVHTHVFDEQMYDDYMVKAGGVVEKIVTIQYWTHEGQPKYPLEKLLKFAQGKLVKVMAAVNMHFPVDEQIRTLEQYGGEIVGIKMYPGYQHFYPSDKEVDPVAEFCTEYGLPLMFHSGSMSARGQPLLKYAQSIHIDELAVRHPKCTIIIAHFGFPYFLETATIVAKNPNVYTDLSGTIDSLPKDADPQFARIAVIKMMQQYEDDLKRVLNYFPDLGRKILFGTDYSGEHSHLREVELYIELVKSVFSKRGQDLVLSETARKFFF